MPQESVEAGLDRAMLVNSSSDGTNAFDTDHSSIALSSFLLQQHCLVSSVASQIHGSDCIVSAGKSAGGEDVAEIVEVHNGAANFDLANLYQDSGTPNIELC